MSAPRKTARLNSIRDLRGPVLRKVVLLPNNLQLKLHEFLNKYRPQWICLEIKEKVFCGKKRCKKCNGKRKGHIGPYVYIHYKINGRLHTKYLGKIKIL